MERDNALLKAIWAKFQEYIKAFDDVEIKNSLKIAMEISSLCNKYLQDEEAWAEANQKSGRSKAIMFVAVNVIRFISAIFEPFMPSFSAKVNYMLGVERKETDDVFFENLLHEGNYARLVKLIPADHKLNKPVPLFQESNSKAFH